MIEEVEFTPEELVVLEGEDVEEEVQPTTDIYGEEIVADVQDETTVEEEQKEEVKEEKSPEESELEQLRRASAGILNDLRGTRKELKEARDWRHGLESRMEVLAKKDEGEEEGVVEPNRDEDPLGWIAWKQKESVEAVVQPLKDKQEEEEQGRKFAAAEKHVYEVTSASQDGYMEKEGISREDFNERMGQVRENRLKWHIATGMDPQTALNTLKQEERGFLYSAVSQGEDPATEAMKLWDMMIGGDKNATVQKTPAESAGEGAKFDKVEAAKRGQSTAGLGDIPGGATGTRITFDQFANMDPEDPIAAKIFDSRRLLEKITVHGEVSI